MTNLSKAPFARKSGERRLVLQIVLITLACAGSVVAQSPGGVRLEMQDSNSSASLRGLSVVDGNIAWASGSGGTVLRTTDAGKSWADVSIDKASELDFRDIQAFDQNTAIVISAGSPGMVFRTVDAGRTWKLCYQNNDANIFFDAMDFWTSSRGIAFSDPLEGRLMLIQTDNEGKTWTEFDKSARPETLDGEAGFAGSGTCLVTTGKKDVWVGLGGNLGEGEPFARIMHSADAGETWTTTTSTIRSTASSGIFSLAFLDSHQAVAVGGDYKKLDDSSSVISRTEDGGKSWQNISGQPPRGFRSAVSVWSRGNDKNWLVAAGPSGVDVSTDHGKTWRAMSDEGFHAVAFSRDGSAGWSTGADGRIGRWTLDAANSQSGIGVAVDRVGDEIMVCGKMFHTTTPVVLWMDKGGYDAYRVEKRFADLAQSSWKASQEKLDTPNRYNIRKDRLTEDQLEQVRGGGWTLDLLQNVVDQFVIHYDVCGTSRQCFKILHDVRGLSIHFMLDIDGTIYQTLDLKERAWHATISNSRSIGIEIANIGAYPPSNMRTLNQWYKPGANGEPRITLPKSMGDGGVLTKGFVGQPIRLAPVTGIVQGEELVQYDLTPQQYRALAKLTATLCRVFPRIECDYPRDDKGELIPRKLDGEKLKKYQGILGHYHVQSNKTDPGPAFQWDKVINESRKLME